MSGQITEQDVRMVYQALLNGTPESDNVIRALASAPMTLEQFIETTVAPTEMTGPAVRLPEVSKTAAYEAHNGPSFLCPRDLRVEAKLPPRILLLGSCFLDYVNAVSNEKRLGYEMDLLHIDMHPTIPAPRPWEEYRYQIGQISLRAVFSDSIYFEWIRNGFADLSLAERIFRNVCDRLRNFTEKCASWSDKIPVFMMNFLSPMQSVSGRLFGKSDLRDNRYFIRQLNLEFERIVASLNNVYILDVDECAANLGRRFFQEDSVWLYVHGGLINDSESTADAQRIEKQLPISSHYKMDQSEFVATMLSEAEASYRSLRGVGAVKMVCVDLDDTLWRGVLAESDYVDNEHATGGWPLGVMEALAALKRRGILLCILSKNNEETVRRIWDQLYARLLPLEEFAIRKINWKSKADNLRDAIAEANILPSSVVFLDDNPVERHAVASALPGVRVIDASHYYWKRILMWSAETQGAVITDESTRRTEMVRAQIEREATRATVSREEFLRDLNLQVAFARIGSRDDPRFPRVVELVNKTNQFNTTGRRWTAEELEDVCRRGIVLTADVSDRFSRYGLVAVVLFLDGVVEQMVMSCRVLGMDVEGAAMSMMTALALETAPMLRARTIETKANLLSRDLFQRCGWSLVDGVWQTSAVNPMPPHINFEPPVR